MPSATRTVDIAAPMDAVFAFFTDPDNDVKWRDGVKEMRAEGPPVVGGVVRQTIVGPGGRAINADIEITELTVPTRYEFKTVSGPVRPVGSYTFTAAPSGTTVTFILEADVRGVKKLFMTGPVQKSMDAEMSALDKAKALLER